MDISIARQVDISTIPVLAGAWEYPPVPETEETQLQRRIRERLDAIGKTPYAVSREIGANPGYVRDILDPAKTSTPSAKRMMDLARVLETTTEYLMGDAGTPEPVRSEVALSDRRIDWRGPRPDEPGIPLVGTGDCADLEVRSDSGAMVAIDRASFDPEYHVTYIQRPDALRGDREAYAIYFHGSSMEPRFFAGEIGIAQPTRPPRPGDYVVVQLTNGASDDVASVLVKRLVRVAGDVVELEQHNPALVFRLPRRQVKRMHRIIPPTDMLIR